MKRPCGCDRYREGQPHDPSKDCRLCWLYWNDPRYRAMWSEPAAKPPSMARRAVNVVTEHATWAAAGMPRRSDDEVETIKATCAACPHFNGTTCALCGCIIAWKARLATAHCPLDPPKW